MSNLTNLTSLFYNYINLILKMQNKYFLKKIWKGEFSLQTTYEKNPLK
jgi:hypothetical protein